jgi:hypothetical protein
MYVWSQLAGIRTPPIVTSDFLYIRFIGDKNSIQEKGFDKIQNDRIVEMSKWAKNKKSRSRRTTRTRRLMMTDTGCERTHTAGAQGAQIDMLLKNN